MNPCSLVARATQVAGRRRKGQGKGGGFYAVSSGIVIACAPWQNMWILREGFGSS